MPWLKPLTQETLDAIAEEIHKMAEAVRAADPAKIWKWESNHNMTFHADTLDSDDPEVAADEFTVRIEWHRPGRRLSEEPDRA